MSAYEDCLLKLWVMIKDSEIDMEQKHMKDSGAYKTICRVNGISGAGEWEQA